MKKYWLERTANNFPIKILPSDFPRKFDSSKRFDAEREEVTLNSVLFEDLKNLSKANGCSLYTIVLSGVSLLLYRVYNNSDFVLALAMAEQSFLSRKRLVGNCVALLPYISCIDVSDTVTDYLSSIQNEIIALIDNHEYSLVELMSDKPNTSDNSQLVHVTSGLTYIKKIDRNDLPARGYEVSYQANPKAYENFEIYFIALESTTGIELKCSFNSKLFLKETIVKWLDFLVTVFNQMVKRPTDSIDSIFSLPDKELNRIKKVRQNKISSNDSKMLYNVKLPSVNSKKERQMLDIWQQLLGRKQLTIHSNFFTSGGHSLLAAELFVRIENEFGINLPLSTLYKCPSVHELTAFLDMNDSKVWKSLVPIQTNGNKPPLYLVHGAEGNVLLYHSLAVYLGDEQPVYGFQSVGLDGSTEFNPEFKHTAEIYIRELRKHQPKGPYFLGGYCLGGSIAFEMAHQLISLGEKVPLVVMFENYNVQAIEWPQPFHLKMVNKGLNIVFHLKNLLSSENNRKLQFLRQKAATEWSRFKINNRIWVTQMSNKFQKGDNLSYKHIMVDKAFDKALIYYKPEPLEGKIAMFTARDRFAGFEDPLFGWKGLALKGLEIHKLPVAPRGSLVEPYVQILAKKLKDVLERTVNDTMDISNL